MSDLYNEIYLERAKERFEDAYQDGDIDKCELEIKQLRHEGFDKEADNLQSALDLKLKEDAE